MLTFLRRVNSFVNVPLHKKSLFFNIIINNGGLHPCCPLAPITSFQSPYHVQWLFNRQESDEGRPAELFYIDGGWGLGVGRRGWGEGRAAGGAMKSISFILLQRLRHTYNVLYASIPADSTSAPTNCCCCYNPYYFSSRHGILLLV